MAQRFDKLERQVLKLIEDLDRLRRENVTLRAENSKMAKDLEERLDRADKLETTSARFLKLKEEHARFKQERSHIRREARGLLKRVRALKKGGHG